MADITSYGALSRHITEYLTTDKRVKYYKCKTLQNPDYCFNGTLYTPVDATYKADTVTSAGSISLASKGIVSVGIKNADDQYKFIGLRPDEKQNGDEQMEICPELIEINGKAQTIDLSKRTAINSITTQYGTNLYTQSARQRLRVMMGADDSTESFKMSLRLYLTGLKVEYIEALDEYWIFNTAGKFRFRLGKPYLVDPKDMNPLCDEFGIPYQNAVKHSLTEVAKGEYLYVKEPDKGFSSIKLPKSFLIDADTVYSSTADGRIYGQGNIIDGWSAVRNGTTGTVQAAETTVVISGQASSVYYCQRGFFYYALTGLSGTVSDVSEYWYGDSGASPETICTQKGTQADTLESNDYDNFSGDIYGYTASIATSAWNGITYNEQGESDVESALNSTFKTCVRNYPKDYGNSAPLANSYLKVRSANYTNTTYDPYLYVTMAAAGSLPLKNVFGRPFRGVFR